MGKAYRSAALLFLNTFLLFVIVNVALGIGFFIRDRHRKVQLGGTVIQYGIDHVARAYPQMSRAQVEALLAETHRSNALEYAPFTTFRASPARGRYVNVDQNGFRHNREQCAWPPPKDAFTVFMFGGSTTFGTGVADADTIPSQLQDDLRKHGAATACVYNFAQPGWSSAHERIAFQQLLVAGHRPEAAVVIVCPKKFPLDDIASLLRAFERRAAYPG